MTSSINAIKDADLKGSRELGIDRIIGGQTTGWSWDDLHRFVSKPNKHIFAVPWRQSQVIPLFRLWREIVKKLIEMTNVAQKEFFWNKEYSWPWKCQILWKIRKRFVAAWSVLETYLCCGVIFGWPNLKKIFIQENVFCTDVIPVSNETSFDITATVVADNVSTTIPPTTLPDESLGLVPKDKPFYSLNYNDASAEP